MPSSRARYRPTMLQPRSGSCRCCDSRQIRIASPRKGPPLPQLFPFSVNTNRLTPGCIFLVDSLFKYLPVYFTHGLMEFAVVSLPSTLLHFSRVQHIWDVLCALILRILPGSLIARNLPSPA
ncbi:hypothetical protein RB195_002541 [Necator americanus]|uniref:Uncharacterized protein n=1 Tax=Necator americanus TaxID=51031 RepID=A0ABR1DMD8_NECAM